MTPVQQVNFSFETLKEGIEGFSESYASDITPESFFGFPLSSIVNIENKLLSSDSKNIAYFSMEYGLAPSIYNSFESKRPMNPHNKFFIHHVFSNRWLCDYFFKIHIDKLLDIPIYGGGLGVLAGDSVKSAADEGFPLVGLGILWNKGYFKQKFWYKKGQVPTELKWDPWTYPGLIPLKDKVVLNTKEGNLVLRLWKYYVYSFDHQQAVPLILLDSDVAENPEHFRRLTDQLYRSDDVWWKIFQRAILGIGGMKALVQLGYHIERYHLNEGHAAFALIEKYVSLADKSQIGEFKKKFVYTCHTPVVAGHDRFSFHDLSRVLGDEYVHAATIFGKEHEHSDQVNLTYMCLSNCERYNAVAQKHGEIMRLQFPQFAPRVQAITNGVHLHTWLSQSYQHLFDKYKDTLGDWRRQPQNLIKVMDLKANEQFRRDVFEAHMVNKRNFLNIVRPWQLSEDVLTIAWARRIAGYKRPALIFHNVGEILKLAYNHGPLQIIIAGKAHPNDNIGGAHIEEILDHINQLSDHKNVVKVLILENYDTYFGKLLTNSVDVWLNNPLPPFEASGTSGMKAILNGVVQCSTSDGWVVEAENDDIGWIFGYRHQGNDIGDERNLRLDEDSQALYSTLEKVIGLYNQTYKNGHLNVESPWIDKMITCISKGAFFNTQRMITQYKDQLWS